MSPRDTPASLDELVRSPFARLTLLLEGISPGAPPIDLSLGEPKALIPSFLGPTLQDHLGEFGRYPPIKGIPSLRNAIAAWIGRRYPVLKGAIDPESHVLPLNGSREGLFSAIFPASSAEAASGGTGRPDPEPVLPGLCRGRGGIGCRAPLSRGARGGRLPAGPRTHRPLHLQAHGRLLPQHAVEPARRGRKPPLPRPRGRAGAGLRFRPLRRRMLFRDLWRHPASGRARDGLCRDGQASPMS